MLNLIRVIITAFLLSPCLNLAVGSQLSSDLSRTQNPNHQQQIHNQGKLHQFIHRMVEDYHYSRKQITQLLSSSHYLPRVIELITHPYEKKPWYDYKAHFLNQERIAAGVQYWHDHQKTLASVEKKIGVPASVLVSIIGVETHYGKQKGSFSELDALTTLAFDYPKRSHFFESELIEFLLMTKEQHFSPQNIHGSYAGALGIPQFMPSSYRKYGASTKHPYHIDIFENHDDAIESIANFLHKAGWKKNTPIALLAKITRPVKDPIISTTGKPDHSLKYFDQHGITPQHSLASHKHPLAALIKMDGKVKPEYWLVFQNFRAIMHYNPRTTYALAVFELSDAIRKAYDHRSREGIRPSST